MFFDKFRQAQLRLRINGKKCKFAADRENYLGHYITREGLSVDKKDINIITKWLTPKTTG